MHKAGKSSKVNSTTDAVVEVLEPAYPTSSNPLLRRSLKKTDVKLLNKCDLAEPEPKLATHFDATDSTEALHW